MKYDKLFTVAKEKGISDLEIVVSTSNDLSFSLFQGEIDSYTSSSSSSYFIRGIYNNHLGSVNSDIYNNSMVEYLLNQIIESAKYIENDDPVFIFEGSKKYKKINTFNKELEKISIDEKMKKLYELEKKIKEGDKRICEVESVEYEESSYSETMINSKGLKLASKNNYFVYYGAALGQEKGQSKTGADIYFGNNFADFDVDKLAKNIVEDTVSQLGGEPCKSGIYKAVLSQEVVKSLMGAYISSACSEDVQKNSSLFVGKLHQKVASKKVTVMDMPLKKTLFSTWFDAEGVATYNKPIIKNGQLMTYLYSLSTAAKDGVETTGNAIGAGSKVYTGPHYLQMKPGKKSLEELFAKIGDGVYITDVSGLHAGLNSRSGNFSLQSTGFLIKNGKKDHPLDIITISGNLLDLFNDVVDVGNDSKEFMKSTFPSILVKKIAVSGK